MLEGGHSRWASALNKLSLEDRQWIAFDGQDKLDVLNNLQTLTNSAKTKSIENRWRFHRPGRGGETVILWDLFSKIAVWIDRFREIGDIVVQFDPVHAALPWAGVRFLLQVAVNDINKFNFVVEGAETIARSIARFAMFEDVYLRRGTLETKSEKALEEALIRLYATILVYLARVKLYFEQSTAKRALKAVARPQDEFEGLIREISQEQSNVDRYTSLVDAEHSNHIRHRLQALSIDQVEKHAELLKLLESIDSPISRMSNHLEQIEDYLSHSERVKILSWLSSQPYLEHHQQVNRQALAGSGQWLLQDPAYTKWLSDSVSSLLWLHGPPGSGKSTLASIIIEDAMKRFRDGQSPLPVYFYCSRSAAEPERSNSDAVLASILRQLSCFQPGESLLPPVIEKYRKQGEGFRSDGLQLEESRELIVELIGNYGITTIVVDALDECDPETRQSLLDAFEDILQEAAGLVKIFVSSRDDQDIVCILREYPNLDISSDKNTHDIQNFVRIETEKLVSKRRLLRNSRAREEMQALIIEQVSAGAEGMFRWASLQLELLCAQKLDDDVRSKLGRLPPKLEQLYVEAYDLLTSYSGDTGHCIIDNAFKWLLSARRTLNASEFLWAVAINLTVPIEDVTRQTVLDLCHNFVLYDEGLDIFRFAHLSVREFLETRSEFSEVSCDSLAAESCLLHMIASSTSSGVESTLRDGRITCLRRRIASARDSKSANFFGYANRFWMDHCQRVLRNDRPAHTCLGRILRYFLLEDSDCDSASNAWTQWYCNTVLEWNASTLQLQLQTLLSGCSNSLSKSFFVAVAYGFTEVVDACLQTEGPSEEEKSKALLMAVIAAQYDTFDQLLNGKVYLEITEPILYHAIRKWDRERLARLLDKSTSVSLTTRMMEVACLGQNDGRVTLLLEKYPDPTVTSKMLEDAITNDNQEMFDRLLARASDSIITERVLEEAIRQQRLENFVLLLDRAGDSCLTSSLMTYAAAEKKRKPSMEIMLTRGGVTKITKEVMVEAAQSPDQEMLNLLLLHGGVVTQEVLIEVASSVNAGVLDVLLEQGCEINGQILNLAAQRLWKLEVDVGLGVMLNRADEAIIAEVMDGLLFHVARNAQQTAIMRQLLDHAGITKIPEDVLTAAARNIFVGSELMQIFLEQGRASEITADLLPYAVANLELHVVLPLLDRVEATGIVDVLLDAAGSNSSCGDELLRILLRKAKMNELPERLLRKTIRNLRGKEMILALEEVFGLIEMTEDRMVTLVREATSAEILSGWLEPPLITEKVLISALSNWNPDVRNSIVEKSLHLAVTIGVLKAAAQKSGLPCFRFLWNRGRIAKVPEDLMKEVAKNPRSLDIVEFLLDEAEEIETGEEFMLAVAENSFEPVLTFNLLLEHGIQLEVKEAVFKAAILDDNDSLFLPWVLQRNAHLKVTDDIFKIAASAGKEATLHRLSEYCGMESTPEKWLDIARMFDAARDGNIERSKDLLDRGVDPNVARPDGWTPLFAASRNGYKLATQMLLSAGAAPDPICNQRTPLCSAAESGDYRMVVILVEAGASLDFRNEEGYTPAMIARDNGHLKVFRYLEQCRETRKQQKDQE